MGDIIKRKRIGYRVKLTRRNINNGTEKTNKPKIINMRDLFNLPDEDDNLANSNIKEAEISRLKPFGNHPFRLYEGERLDDMVESIKEHGILMPLIVRPVIIDLEDKDVGKYDYEILSGHNGQMPLS